MRAPGRPAFRRSRTLGTAGLTAVVLLLAGAATAGAVPVIVTPAPPVLSATTVRPGETLTATSRYANVGTTTGVLGAAAQTIRRPGQPHDHPAIWDGDFTNPLTNLPLAPNAEVQQTGTLTLAPSAPIGQWEAYASWRDAGGVWHDGPSATFTVAVASPPPPVVTNPTPTPAPTAPVVIPTPTPPATVAPEVVTPAAPPATVPPVAATGQRTLDATQAVKQARLALRRVYGTALTRATRFTATCARRSRATRSCAVSWRYKRFRYRGTVLVQLTATAYTTVVDVRRSRVR